MPPVLVALVVPVASDVVNVGVDELFTLVIGVVDVKLLVGVVEVNIVVVIFGGKSIVVNVLVLVAVVDVLGNVVVF